MFAKRKRYDLDDLKSRDSKTLTSDEATFLIMEPIDRYRREQDEANRQPLLYSLVLAAQGVAIIVGIFAILIALDPVFAALERAFDSVSFWVAAAAGAVIVATQLLLRRLPHTRAKKGS